ncbi:hypothetical protein BDN70DRAFT_920858 [Pholiota conissans]|uniref:Uncharacterized protein n=1 Tax=Pholiota conissans TaxID=109636 RepID=A0A9P5Z4A9_9AGAR|nr:hypothetical protein BDN70DRAFT_920858 [Pholiota conissans]
MPTRKASIRLDMSSVHASSFHSRDFDPSSPYPPSSPSTDSSDAEDLPRNSKTSLRSSIAELSETRLRSILLKLAGSNPRFERAIRKEIALTHTSGDSPPLTPTSPKPRRVQRHKHRRSCREIQIATQEEPMLQHPGTVSPSLHFTRLQEEQDEFWYHPGVLDREVYEFLPHAPTNTTVSDMRTVTMWSCCNEDEWSPGCMVLSPFLDPLIQDQCVYGRNVRESSRPDVLPDSDLERRIE